MTTHFSFSFKQGDHGLEELWKKGLALEEIFLVK